MDISVDTRPPAPRVAHHVIGPPGSGKTGQILTRADALMRSGQGPRMLILASNPMRQHAMAERWLARLEGPMGALPLYTFAGFVRNALFNAWPVVETRLARVGGPPAIRPALGGMGDSEWLLRALLAQGRQHDAAFFAAFEGSDAALIKQLTRRLRLRAENRLSRRQMRLRALHRLEPCAEETAWMDQAFDRLCYHLRALDANKQLETFFGLLEDASPPAQRFASTLRREIAHLLVDDVEETTAAQQAFVTWLAPSIETLTLSMDPDGGSRQGYLNAYPQGWQQLKTLGNASTTVLTRTDPLYENAQTLARNWRDVPEKAQPLGNRVQVRPMASTRLDMLDNVAADVIRWLEQGYAPGDMVVITPHDDALTRQALHTRLRQRGVPMQWLSGSDRPYDQPACRAYVTLLHWLNAPMWRIPLSPVEIRALLVHGLRVPGLDPVALHDLSTQWALALAANARPQLPETLSTPCRQRLKGFLQWSARARDWSFETQLYRSFSEIISEFSSGNETFGAIQRVMESYVRQKALWEGLVAHGSLSQKILAGGFERRWLTQVKAGVVADTPDTPIRPDPEALVVGTPQKIIDADMRRAIQVWLDASSRHWMRTDRAPLYDAAAYAPDAMAAFSHATAAEAPESPPDDTPSREAVRAACLTRTLMALARERVIVYASELDDMGDPQAVSDGLWARLRTDSAMPVDLQALKRPALRPDQRPILAYRQGTMAISAAPGAGKTYVNTALIVELIASGVPPQHILALTYMDSAARTLQNRLKALLGPQTPLPVISTIHSLALRLLSEGDHGARVGFFAHDGADPTNTSILDDAGQDAVLSPLAARTCPQGLAPGTWQNALRRGIAHAKTFRLPPEALAQARVAPPYIARLRDFNAVYGAYEAQLAASGRVDFTGLILKAVELLERHDDVRHAYQARFTVLLEDEAQDSSALLQRLLALLGGDTPNLIRTGDPNQSITTTFSAADPQAFRAFVAQADHVVTLDRSGRCAPEIMALANAWLETLRADPAMADAFSPMTMRAVSPGEGPVNPTLLRPLQAVWHEQEADEIAWLLAEATAFRQAHPGASVALLTLTNDQALAWAGHLQQAGIEAIAITDRLNGQGAFSLMLAYLRLLAAPGDCLLQVACYDALVAAHLTPSCATRRAFLHEHALMAQSPQALAALNDAFLAQWAYDLQDFVRDSLGCRITRLLTRLSDHLFRSAVDRSNGYLCALQAEKFLKTQVEAPWSDTDASLSPLESVIQHFDALQRSPRRARAFSDLLHASTDDGFVRVMTLHKAKGQEFDLVMMPGLRADAETFRVDEADKLIQAIDAARPDADETLLCRDRMRRQKQEERARLIYVGLTRARRALLLSGARLARNRYGKLSASEPARAFTMLERLIAGMMSVAAPPPTPLS